MRVPIFVNCRSGKNINFRAEGYFVGIETYTGPWENVKIKDKSKDKLRL
jgi:hypothetical protein